eukprot:12816269-Prorocentrum_lima.AAC.1
MCRATTWRDSFLWHRRPSCRTWSSLSGSAYLWAGLTAIFCVAARIVGLQDCSSWLRHRTGSSREAMVTK